MYGFGYSILILIGGMHMYVNLKDGKDIYQIIYWEEFTKLRLILNEFIVSSIIEANKKNNWIVLYFKNDVFLCKKLFD